MDRETTQARLEAGDDQLTRGGGGGGRCHLFFATLPPTTQPRIIVWAKQAPPFNSPHLLLPTNAFQSKLRGRTSHSKGHLDDGNYIGSQRLQGGLPS